MLYRILRAFSTLISKPKNIFLKAIEISEGLRLARFVFTVKALQEMTLPGGKGSMLRGVLGHGLFQAACRVGRRSCDLQCPAVHHCTYVYLFQTQRPEQHRVFERTRDIPHPFVLLPPLDGKRCYRSEEELAFSLILVGRAIDLFPYVVEAFRRMGEVGLGADRRGYRLEGVESLDGRDERKTLYRAGQDMLDMDFPRVTAEDLRTPELSAGQLGLEFMTLTQMREGGRLIFPKDFFTFFRALVSRLSLLYHFHCTDSAGPFHHFDALKERAKSVRTISRKLHRHRQERYSNRQGRKHSIEGLVGRMAFEGDLAEFFPFLLLGEQVHIGKGTVYGCGKYVLSGSPL